MQSKRGFETNIKAIIVLGALVIAIVAVKQMVSSRHPAKSTQTAAIQPSSEQGSNEAIAEAMAKNLKLSPICANKTQVSDVYDCYNTYYTNLTENSGVQAAFADLRARYASGDQGAISMCHPLAHVIGRAATIKYPVVSEAYTHGDNFCWSGYYHGVMEGIIGRIGRKNLAGDLNSICTTIPGKERYSFDYYNCVHGLGHGIMETNNEDLPNSLVLCDYLSGSWEQESCYSGVFMENIIADGIDHTTTYLKPDDLMYPCDWVAEKYRQVCYLVQSSYAIEKTHGDFTQVFALCAGVEKAFVDTCYQSLGRDASGRSAYTQALTIENCMKGDGYDQLSNCFIGAAKDYVSNFHSDVQAKQLCNALEPDLMDVCNDTVTQYYKIL